MAVTGLDVLGAVLETLRDTIETDRAISVVPADARILYTIAHELWLFRHAFSDVAFVRVSQTLCGPVPEQ
jgi:hypothetical protein